MSINVRRLFSVSLAFILVISLALSLAAPVLAASTKKTIDKKDQAFGWNKCESINVRTGKGIFYSMGWKKTTVTIQNTGSQNISVYQYFYGPIYKGGISPGRSLKITLGGSNKAFHFMVQGGRYRSGNYGSFTVNTSAGSVW